MIHELMRIGLETASGRINAKSSNHFETMLSKSFVNSNEKPFNVRVALVTGASGGIGRALALRLATEGAVVAVGYSASSEQAKMVVSEIAAEGGRAIAFRADLAQGGGFWRAHRPSRGNARSSRFTCEQRRAR